MKRFKDRFQKKDRGSVLLEAIVSLGIISVLTLGYTATATSATITQRTAVNDSIATQVTQDVFETARSTPWSKIGTKTKPDDGMLPSGATAIYEPSDALATTGTKTLRGLKVTVKTAVAWQDKPGGTSAFGTKTLIVDVSWRDNELDADSAHSRRESTIITPGIGEAAPSKVRSANEAAVLDPPAVPALTGSIVYEGPKAQASWNTVPGADAYSIQYRINGGGWVTKNYSGSLKTALIDGEYGDVVDMKIKSSGPTGESYYSPVVTVTLPVPPAMPVITGTVKNTLDAEFSWPAVPTATSYWTEKRINGGAWTIVNAAQTGRTLTVTATAGDKVEARVKANLYSISGPYSAISTVTVEELPAVPVVTGSADDDASATFTWPAAARATGYRVEKQINSGAWTVVSEKTTSRTATVTGTGGNALKLRVQSVGAAGSSAYSATAVVTLPNRPATPVVTGKLNPETESVDFTWPSVNFASSYRIEYKYGTGAWQVLSTASKGNSANVAAKGNALVTVRVRADNGAASSDWSENEAVAAPTTPIGWKYELMNGAKILGEPTGGEISSVKGGKYRIYAKGAILWHPSYGAYASVNGPIRDKYLAMGGHTGGLGYPLGDAVAGLKDGGSSQKFEGASIVYSPATGAYAVFAGMGSKWADTGWENGQLGYPTTDEVYGMKDGWAYQNYQGGAILWNPKTGTAYASVGAIRAAWAAQDFERGPMGYPQSDEYWIGNVIRQNYQGGYYTWTEKGGVVTHR
ncbi:hypothetical protein [Arthrobacter sp. zg-Y1110]|uniref:hypothetical protein n=1 Tax=Arthrobacter sp. zg-Y1110 TaxID=2886932 RepID=UPI001D1396F6|nr:hypothetical protein [Arthrobacter sp. zg-Y1110]MCC3292577.1 hypothetical protein [Arthrobacter sp. zg-Y1110]UWX86990.1 hypothetical protein N2K99_16705 [Arthrobacter sp. zg-Y1110]